MVSQPHFVCANLWHQSLAVALRGHRERRNLPAGEENRGLKLWFADKLRSLCKPILFSFPWDPGCYFKFRIPPPFFLLFFPFSLPSPPLPSSPLPFPPLPRPILLPLSPFAFPYPFLFLSLSLSPRPSQVCWGHCHHNLGFVWRVLTTVGRDPVLIHTGDLGRYF